MQTNAHGQTDIGQRRDQNEDYFLMDEALGLFAVCDGMGGHAAGEIASREAAQGVQAYLHAEKQRLDELRKAGDAKGVQLLVCAAIQHASKTIHDEGERSGQRGMGTTITLMLTMGDRAVIASVGDSRAYHCREKRVTRLTDDHTLAHEMLVAGQFTEEEARESPFQHYLTRSLGPEDSVEVDTLVAHLFAEDLFLLCTDGLTRYFESSEQLGKFMFYEPSKIPEELIAYANACGGKDNITVVVLHVSEDDQPRLQSNESTQKWFTRVA